MRISKSLFVFAIFGAVSLLMSCTDDWGQMDPAAGNQVYPTRTLVGTYSFDADDISDLDFVESISGNVELVLDDSTGTNVLHLNGGYVRMVNPFLDYTLQAGAGVAMFVRTENVSSSGALFSFGDSDVVYATLDGGIGYVNSEDSSLSLDEAGSSILPDDEWHYVAYQFTTTGYTVYVDNEEAISVAGINVDGYESMIASINNAEYIYLGGGANGIDLEDVYVDQLRLVRNTMSTADINRTLNGSDSDGFQYVIEFGGTTIGSTDCSTSWWSAFSDYYRIPANGSIHLTFTNYTDGVNNWDNFLVVFTNDYGRDDSEYSEYVVLRADAYGWGTKYNSDYMYSEYDWDTFTSEMAGANVDMTLSRTGSMVYMDCTLTMSEGTVRSYTYYFDCGTSEDVVRVFLTVEAGYLVLDTSSCTGSAPLTIETSTVGSTDCSTSWWSAFSDYFTVVPGGALHLEFTNYTDGVNNWDNFLVVFTNPYERTESEYSEYVVLRADAYGWGDKYNSDYMYSEYDWDTFTTEMNGAYVEMDVTRVGTMVYMNCDLTMSDKTERTYTYYFDCGTKEDNINVFLLTEAGYFVLETSKCTSGSPLY